MTEPGREPPSTRTSFEPVEPTLALARKNMAWGFALFGVSLLLFGGTVLIAFAYLWLD